MKSKNFKKGDKVICITDVYSTIKLGQIVTIEYLLDANFFLIEESVGAYEVDDFVKPKLIRGEL